MGAGKSSIFFFFLLLKVCSFLLSACVLAKLLPSCLTLGDPVDCGSPGFSVHGILQARILEWIIMPFVRGSS